MNRSAGPASGGVRAHGRYRDRHFELAQPTEEQFGRLGGIEIPSWWHCLRRLVRRSRNPSQVQIQMTSSSPGSIADRAEP